MNRFSSRRVKGVVERVKGVVSVVVAALPGLLFGVGGCVRVDGGALEGAWVINVAEKGVRIDCACGQLADVVFSLEPQGGAGQDPCGGSDRCRFACGDGVGTTRFVVPEGRYAIAIVPMGSDGELLGPEDGVIYPPPVVRDVREGELTSLGVSLFIVARARLAGPDHCDEDWLTPP